MPFPSFEDKIEKETFMALVTWYRSKNKDFTLSKGNTLEVLTNFDFKFNMIFADPPYLLSNGGISVQSGKQVIVNKGEWDKSHGLEEDLKFYRTWINLCKDKLQENGTIWISGTYHNIFLAAQVLNELNFKILNVITWAKTNPPPNLSCRYFTFSTEFIIWARKNKNSSHYYNYELMKDINGGTQMRDIWTLPAIAKWEKSCGKHPTQKPLPLLARIILASTKPNEWILDPFTGSSTTGIASSLLGRRFLGIDMEESYLNLSKDRREEIDNPLIRENYFNHIERYNNQPLQAIQELREMTPYYGIDLPCEDNSH